MLAAGSVWLRKRSWKTLNFKEMKLHFKTHPTPLAWPHGSLPHGYAHFVHACDLWSISCPIWEFLLFCRSLSKILINTPHYPSFLSLSIHTWWQEDGSHCSQDPISTLSSPSVLPKPNRLICNQKKKIYIVLNIWKWYLKRQFLQKSSGSNWMFTTQQQMSSSHTARSVLVILFTSFI